MGTVWEADDLVLHRRVAVKILSPWMCDNETVAARFHREAQAAGRLVHPNIAAVFDFGDEQGCPFIVMELVHGRNLREVLDDRTRLPADEAADIAAQVADALAAAHAEGIVHRDIKPGNVMLTHDGRVKVMDFGIADASWFDPITDTGTVMATARYISPEQATGSSGGPASDVYSLGVVLYEMLAGRPPFEGTSPFAIAAAHAYEVPPPVSRFAPSLPSSVAAAVDLATRKDPRERPSADALAERLRGAGVAVPTDVRPVRAGASEDDTAALETPAARSTRGFGVGWVVAAGLLGLLFLGSVVAATSGGAEPGRRPIVKAAVLYSFASERTREPAVEERPDREEPSSDRGPDEHGGGPGNGQGNAYGHDKGNGNEKGDGPD